jgi:chromosome partitioning protein
MQGFDLARVVMSTDAILMPVCNSIFDRDSAAACHAELLTLPRVASGRCKLGVIGMRLDARTHAAETLREWAAGLKVPFLGVLRETQHYVKSLENGQTIFDLPARLNQGDMLQWEPILEWLGPVMGTAASKPKPQLSVEEMATSIASDHSIQTSRVPSLMPAQVALVHGDRLSVFANHRTAH